MIDASPDLRTQLLRSGTRDIDGVIITHDHADHTHGMDDLRPFTFGKKGELPVYTSEETHTSLSTKFPYIFQRDKVFAEKPVLGGGIPLLKLSDVGPGTHVLSGHPFEFFFLPHGHIQTLCFLQGKLGYIVDCQEVPEGVLEKFQKAELTVLVIDCLRREAHQTHLHLELTLKYIHTIRPKTAVLIHMGHEWDHHELLRELRMRGANHVIPALDGQSFLYPKD